MRIALLDNDPEQRRLIAEVLAKAGHTLVAPEDSDIELLIADENMDLQAVRTHLLPSTPVLLLASRHNEDGILAVGATDYLIKPIRRHELATRLQVLLRRAYPEREEPEQVRFGDYLFEPKSGRIRVADKQVVLTQKEFQLALLFFRHLDRPLSRATIQDHIWMQEPEVPSRTIDTHVSRVRNKLNLKPENGYRLVPVYSYGYRLEVIS
jgi:DNA-binding response OmpR family regulator